MTIPPNFTDVQSYMLEQLPERPDELSAMEQHALETGFPIIGPVAGNMCYQIARIIGARKIFEMGSGYGYSTAWFARAVHENGGGMVHHVVWDDELSNQARVHLSRLGYAKIVQYHVAEAVKTLESTQGTFDLIFNIVITRARAKANFLNNSSPLSLFPIRLLSILLVSELSKVKNFRNRRLGIWRDFDEIQATLASHLEGFNCCRDPNLLTVLIDQTDFSGMDLIVYSWTTLTRPLIKTGRWRGQQRLLKN